MKLQHLVLRTNLNLLAGSLVREGLVAQTCSEVNWTGLIAMGWEWGRLLHFGLRRDEVDFDYFDHSGRDFSQLALRKDSHRSRLQEGVVLYLWCMRILWGTTTLDLRWAMGQIWLWYSEGSCRRCCELDISLTPHWRRG